MSTHNLSCSGGHGVDPTRSALGHVMTNLYFCMQCNMWVMLCILVYPGCESLMNYFLCLSGPSVDPIKSVSGHITPNLCFYTRYDI
jgi:hypothetical protein